MQKNPSLLSNLQSINNLSARLLIPLDIYHFINDQGKEQ